MIKVPQKFKAQKLRTRTSEYVLFYNNHVKMTMMNNQVECKTGRKKLLLY